MKLQVNTIAEIDAKKKAITREDMSRFVSATAGKTMEIELPPTATITDLITGVCGLGNIKPEIAITNTIVLKGKIEVSGASLSACGFEDGSKATIKFVHKTY